MKDILKLFFLISLVFTTLINCNADPEVQDPAVAKAAVPSSTVVNRLHLFDPGTTENLMKRLSNAITGSADFELSQVPNLAPANLPGDIVNLDGQFRKDIFIRSLLPHIIFQNSLINSEREAALTYLFKLKNNDFIPDSLRDVVVSLLDKYRVGGSVSNSVSNDDLPGEDAVMRLLEKVDVVPVSLALAQAANESGWGTSRFAMEGNNLFGHWKLYGPDGMIPEERPEGETYTLARFQHISKAVERYLYNLNTNRAYRDFRKMRMEMRQRAVELDAVLLATSLKLYSERGYDYVLSLVDIIRQNNLERLDNSRLIRSNDTENISLTLHNKGARGKV